MKSNAFKKVDEKGDVSKSRAAKKGKRKKPQKNLKGRDEAKNVVDLLSSPAAAGKIKLTAELRQKLIIQYRVQARKMARAILKSWNAKLDREEIDSLVDLSLCEAVRRYDPKKGASFLTFVYYDIRGHLIRAINEATEQVMALGNEEFLENMHHHNSVSTEEVADHLTSDIQPSPEKILYQKEVMALIQEASKKLSEIEREVLNRVYGQGFSTTETAKDLGYSRSHLSRIKSFALNTLKGELERFLGEDKNSLPFEEKESISTSNKSAVKKGRLGKIKRSAKKKKKTKEAEIQKAA